MADLHTCDDQCAHTVVIPAGSPAAAAEWGVRLGWDGKWVEELASESEADARRRVDMHTDRRARDPRWRVTAELLTRMPGATEWTTVPNGTDGPAPAAACGHCGHPFDPADTSGTGRYGTTRWCRSCVSRCHEATDMAHTCLICTEGSEQVGG